MGSKDIVKKSILARQKGIIHLIVFLIIECVLKIGGVLFLILVGIDYFFGYKAMQMVGIAESIKSSAIIAFTFGVVPAVIGGICTEIIYRRNK